MQTQNEELQANCTNVLKENRMLQKEIRIRDFKFGKVIGVNSSGTHEYEFNDEMMSIADTW